MSLFHVTTDRDMNLPSDASPHDAFSSINPTTGEAIGRLTLHSAEEVEVRLEEASKAFERWRRSPIAERRAALLLTANALRARRSALAALMADEMGKPLAQGLAEADKCAWVCEHYAEQTPEVFADALVATDAQESFVSRRPLGPLLAIMPWNFPLWQFFRHAAPAWALGNTVVLKHAENVPATAAAIESLMRESGLAHLMENLRVDRATTEKLIADSRIAAVTFTGSTRAGRIVGAAAGRALKKSVLELGGSDPYIVLEDADLGLAAERAATSRLTNSGQSCIAAKRIIVVDAVYEEFRDRFVAQMKQANVGDPRIDAHNVGPQARADLRNALHEQVQRSVAAGAKLLLGGELPGGPGFFYPVSVLEDVEPKMAVFDEEVFGPVALLIRALDENAAIDLANNSEFGLGAAIFTVDVERGRRIAVEEIEAGCVAVNDFVRSDPRMPFGGIRASGYGRELGVDGALEFANAKSVAIA